VPFIVDHYGTPLLQSLR